MTNLTRAAVLTLMLSLGLPALALAQDQAPIDSPTSLGTCGLAPTFDMTSSRSMSGRSGRYYPATQMGFGIMPKAWARKGLGVGFLALDVSNAMAWGVGPRWYHRWASTDNTTVSLQAQVVAGSMSTAPLEKQQASGHFAQASMGATVSYKQMVFGVLVDRAEAPAIDAKAGGVAGTRVSFTKGYAFRRYPAVTGGPCGTNEARVAMAQARETERMKTAALRPSAQVGYGFNFPQTYAADFPGLAFTVVGLQPHSQGRGLGTLAEVDLSYVRKTTTVGARAYLSSPSLAEGRFGTVAYAQLLAGASSGGRSGIIHSTGGFTLQPGIGFEFGTNRKAFVIQVDYRFVRGSEILNDRDPAYRDTMNNVRVTLGAVRRFGGNR